MKSIIYFLIAIVPVLGFGQHCTNDTRYTEVDYFNNSDVDTLKNVVYGQAIDWLGSNKVLKMDIYLPKASADPFTARPAVMMIHGGGFYKGSKGTRAKECVALAKRGFVAFSIAYRLGWDSLNPADQLNATYRAQQDANAAMRYMVANRLTYEVDTNWLFVAGSSAGAATALNMVYASQSEWNTVVPGIENNKNTPRFDGKCFYEFYPEEGYLVPENIINPILKPMAYLPNEIHMISPVPNFFNIDYLINTPLASSYEVVEKLLELHYDVFGLIQLGLAVDFNSL